MAPSKVQKYAVVSDSSSIAYFDIDSGRFINCLILPGPISMSHIDDNGRFSRDEIPRVQQGFCRM